MQPQAGRYMGCRPRLRYETAFFNTIPVPQVAGRFVSRDHYQESKTVPSSPIPPQPAALCLVLDLTIHFWRTASLRSRSTARQSSPVADPGNQLWSAATCSGMPGVTGQVRLQIKRVLWATCHSIRSSAIHWMRITVLNLTPHVPPTTTRAGFYWERLGWVVVNEQ